MMGAETPAPMIRPYQPNTDLRELCDIYRRSVFGLARGLYDDRQLAAWAGWANDTDRVAAFLVECSVLVATVDDVPAAFVALGPPDHLALLYTAPPFSRRGIATRLLAAAEDLARAAGVRRIDTDASRASRPLFIKAGYRVMKRESSEYSGMRFERFVMAKELGARSSVGDAPGPR